MQLRDIHIVSFGVLANTRVRGIQPGLNVLYGPNEFGKTSLLEFVRRVLFGFPTRAMKANQYLLPGAERNSGRLTCQLSDGRTFEVFRATGKSGGPVTVTTADGSTMSEDSFATAIGHVSPDLYQKVFSLGLQELYEVDIVNLDEVKDRIYGAGLGGASIPELKSHFEKQASELFTRSGHKQRMKELARDIVSRQQSIRDEKARLAQYDSKKNEHDKLKETAEGLSAHVRTLQAELRHIENQERLFQTFLDMQRAQKQLAEIGEVPEVPDEALAELQNRQNAIKTLDERIEIAREQMRLKKATLERISYDPALLQNEQEIESLSQNVASYRSSREALPSTGQGVLDAREHVEQKLAILGDGWTEDRVRTFVLTAEQTDSLRQQESRLRDCEQSLDNTRRKMEVHTDSIRAAGSRQGVPKWIRLAGMAVMAFGGAGCVLSVLNGDLLTASISGGVALLGLIVAIAPGASLASVRDPAAEHYAADIHAAEEALEMARTEWSAILRHLGLPGTLSPEAKDETLRLVGDLCDELRRLDREKERAAHLQDSLSSVDSRYAAVVKDLQDPLPGDDVAANIETLDARLTSARAEEVRRQSLSEEVLGRGDELKGLQGQREKEAARLSVLLSTYDAPSAAALRERYQRYEESRALRKSISSSLQTIETTAGTGEARTSFIEALAITGPEEIQVALETLRERVKGAENELALSNQQVGALDSELKALVSAEDLVAHEAHVETLLQQLRDAYSEWVTARVALWGIGTAVARYEQERQPDIICAAQTAFVSMTDGRYDKLLKPIDSDELHVRDPLGADRTVDKLSRGTREQLYLAMRMGLIAQYELNAEPMPVIMDDILVNFDDERGPLAVKALSEFAQDRQVIVMTCHKNTLELYRLAGATELAVERDAILL